MTPEEKAVCTLLEITDRLLAPDGCPWDREQTVRSWARMVFEEICEALDSLNDIDPEQLADELGDVLAGTFFLAKAAAKEKGFTSWTLPFTLAAEKLRRRHPHIYANEKLPSDVPSLEQKWEEIKATERHHRHRKSHFDGLPKSLPALALMQKLVHKARKVPECVESVDGLVAQKRTDREEELGRRIAQVIVEAEKEGIQAEHALRLYFRFCREALMEKEGS